TLGLAAVTLLSLIYIVRGVHEEAAKESYRARAPLLGELSFIGTDRADRGLNAGRTWDYRSYIAGPSPQNPNRPRHYAVWTFAKTPAYLGASERPVLFEFTFDIFRLNKGEEGKGIFCTFVFGDGWLTVADMDRLVNQARGELEKLRNEVLARSLSKEEQERELERIASTIAAKYGVYEAPAEQVTDYHTQAPAAPAG